MTAAALPGAQPGYHPAVGGLRVLAIAPVMRHHAAPALLRGGFAGGRRVLRHQRLSDLRDHRRRSGRGRFNLRRFWERRVRRIVPDLAAMLAATGLAAWAIMTPKDFQQFARELLATAVFAANIPYARGTS